MRKNNMFVMLIFIAMMCAPLVLGASSGGFVDVRNKDNFDTGVSSTFVNQNPDPVEPGQYVDVRWKVGVATGTIGDLVIAIDPKYPFTLDASTPQVVTLGDANAKMLDENAFIIRYRLLVDKNAAQGNQRIDLRYSRDGGKNWITLDPFYVIVQVSRPNVEITKVVASPERVQPGGETTMTIDVTNLANVYVQDVRLKLDLDTTTPFAPLDSTNEKSIKFLEPGETQELTFRLITESKAEAKVYKLPLSIQYSDSLGGNYSKDALTALIVGDAPDLVVTAESDALLVPGKRSPITFRFINKGPTGIKFLYAYVNENENFKVLSVKESYVGAVDSDDYQTAEFSIFVNQKTGDKLVIPIDISYSDATNKEYKDTRNVEIPLFTAETAAKYADGQTSPFIGIGIAVAIVVIGLVIYWIVRRRRK